MATVHAMATVGNVLKGSDRQIVLHVEFRSGSIGKVQNNLDC